MIAGINLTGVIVNIFVTGATGFIGKHLVCRLLAGGHAIRCLVRSADRARVLQENGVNVILGDVNDASALKRGMAGCDCLFHLANLYTMWTPAPGQFQQINVEGTRTVLECALTCGVSKVVYVSTVAVYGKPSDCPFKEDSIHGPKLFSEYARTKALAEKLAWEFYDQRGLPLVVLYPGIVLGAGDDKASGHYIQDLIRRRAPSTIFHNSYATYIDVEDLVDALVQAAVRPETIGQKYLLGGQTLNGRDYAQLIQEVSGVRLPLLRLPDWVVLAASYLLTGVSAITRQPPMWGLSVDAGWTLKNGFYIDGSKAERELGIHYTCIRRALSEAIEAYRRQWAQN